jgi:polysaccharide export outer membrane protein
MRFWYFAAMAAGLLMVGCATTKSGKSDVANSNVPTLRDLGGDAEFNAASNLRLRAGDTLEIRLGGVPREEIDQVAGTYSVDTEGYVNIPQVGRVRASGETQEALQMAIEKKYRDQAVYTNPTVTVVVPMATRFVNVGGEVRLPQRIAYTPDLTVLAAISAAGGFTEYASQSRIKLYRDMEAVPIDIRKIRKNPGLDIPLQPGDTVEVMRSFF